MRSVIAEKQGEQCRCNQCGHEWEARVRDPQCCPKCKRYDWDEPKKGESNAAD